VALTGSGAPFPFPLHSAWFKAFSAKSKTVTVDYQGKGSGASIQDFINHTVDFAASDAAMTDEQMAKVPGGVQLLPMTGGDIVIGYNLPGEPKGLKLPRDVEATENRFYDDRGGNIRGLVERHAHVRDNSVWDRAAGLYVHLLSKPQLFIKRNHRSGALLMSYVLMRGGRPPFVLCVANAVSYFQLSAALRDLDKHSPAAVLRLSGIRQRMATLLAEHSDARHLIPLGATSGR
jgi:hypothetical protein